MSDDVARLKEVLAHAEERGWLLKRVSVGQVEVEFVGAAAPAGRRWALVADAPKASPEADAHERAPTADEVEKKKKLVELRKRSMQQFGKVLPDESLLAMDGAL